MNDESRALRHQLRDLCDVYNVLVADKDTLDYRLGSHEAYAVTTEPVERPADFDLETTWRSTLASINDMRLPYEAVLSAPASLLPALRSALVTQPRVRAVIDSERVELEVRSYSPEALARQLAGFGSRVEILAPAEAREHLARLGAELVSVYAPIDVPLPGTRALLPATV